MGTILTKIMRQDASNDLMLVDGPQSTVPHMDYVQDFQMDSSDDITSSNAQYGLLPDGSRRIGGGNRQKQCKMCRKWIDLGNSESGDNALINQEGKSRCLATVHENKLEQERRAAAVVLENLHQTASLSPCTPYRPKQFPPSPCLSLSPLLFVSESSLSMQVVIISNVFLFFMCLPSRKVDKHTRGRVSWHPAGMGR